MNAACAQHVVVPRAPWQAACFVRRSAATAMAFRLPVPTPALVLALTALLSSAPSARTQDSPLAHAIQRGRLDNGLDVVVVANADVPLATVLVAVRSGAFIQDSVEDGLAHLYEHILFRSYHGDPTAFAREAYWLDAAWNGATDEEVVYYFLEVPSQNLDGAIKLISRLVQEPRFSERDLKEERPVVLDELHRYESDPESRLARHVERMLWGSSWSRKDLSGDSSSLAGITLQRLRETYARYYVPNNAALIVTGDVSFDHVMEQAEQHFSDWKPGADPFADRPIPPVAARAASTVVLLPADVPDITIRVELEGPSAGRDTAATYAGDVLFDMLNDPESAFQRRLVATGPFESVQGVYVTRAHTGPIEIVGKAAPAQARQALVMLLAELDSLPALEDIGAEDLAIGKKHRQVQQILRFEQAALLAQHLAFWWGGAGIEYFVSYQDRLAARSLDDLRGFARDFIAASPRVIGVLAPPATTEMLAAWLHAPPYSKTP